MKKIMYGFSALAIFLLFTFVFPFANSIKAEQTPPNDMKYPEITPPNEMEFPEIMPPNEMENPNDISSNEQNSSGEGQSGDSADQGDQDGSDVENKLNENSSDVTHDMKDIIGSDLYDTNTKLKKAKRSGEEDKDPSAYDYSLFGVNSANSYTAFLADMLESDGLSFDQVNKNAGKSFLRHGVTGIGLEALNLGLRNTAMADYADAASDMGEGVNNGLDVKYIFDKSKGGGSASPGKPNPSTLNPKAPPNPLKSPLAKLGSRINVGTSIVSGGVSAVDFGKNIFTANDRNKSYDERSDAVIEGAGDLGNVLMSGGVVAGATGAGAPLAIGLGIAGAALWGGSKLAKWGDKVFDGKVSDGLNKAIEFRDKAVDKTKEFLGNAKDNVKSFFGF